MSSNKLLMCCCEPIENRKPVTLLSTSLFPNLETIEEEEINCIDESPINREHVKNIINNNILYKLHDYYLMIQQEIDEIENYDLYN